MPRHNCASASTVKLACCYHMAAVRMYTQKMMMWLSCYNTGKKPRTTQTFSCSWLTLKWKWSGLGDRGGPFLYIQQGYFSFSVSFMILDSWYLCMDGCLLERYSGETYSDFSPKHLLQGRRQASGLCSYPYVWYPYVFLSIYPPFFKHGSCPFVIGRNIVWQNPIFQTCTFNSCILYK